MLSLRTVTKSFHTIRAVNSLSLELSKGEVFGLIGPNGAGKTTTIKMIVGMYKPDEGTIRVGEHDIQKEPLPAKSLLGYIPDVPTAWEKMTGREFLFFIGRIFSLPPATIVERVENYLQFFPIEETLDAVFEEQSRGTKQKLAIIAALLHSPQLLIIDEPIVGLDPQSILALRKILRDFTKNGGSVLLSTHTLDFAQKVCDRYGILSHGKLIAEGTLASLQEKAALQGGQLEEVFLSLTATGAQQHG